MSRQPDGLVQGSGRQRLGRNCLGLARIIDRAEARPIDPPGRGATRAFGWATVDPHDDFLIGRIVDQADREPAGLLFHGGNRIQRRFGTEFDGADISASGAKVRSRSRLEQWESLSSRWNTYKIVSIRP